MEIYFPMTADILTVGHVRCIEYLSKQGYVTIGLLTDEALKGYKKNIVPFKDRKYIMDTIAMAIGADVVPQDTLDPSKNIRKYKSDAIASGDGWEKVEVNAIRKYRLKKIDIKFKGEKGKRGEKNKLYSSSKLKEKL